MWFGDWIKLNGLLVSPQQNLIIAKYLQDCLPLVSLNKQLLEGRICFPVPLFRVLNKKEKILLCFKTRWTGSYFLLATPLYFF